jgi:hypothetical protein
MVRAAIQRTARWYSGMVSRAQTAGATSMTPSTGGGSAPVMATRATAPPMLSPSR